MESPRLGKSQYALQLQRIREVTELTNLRPSCVACHNVAKLISKAVHSKWSHNYSNQCLIILYIYISTINFNLTKIT